MYAKLVKTISTYFPEEIDTPIMFTITLFLASEVKGNVDIFRDFIIDKIRTSYGGDAISLDKENNKLLLDLEWHDCDETCPNRVILFEDVFLHILDRWEELVTQQPDEIIITQDDAGKISITGKFADGREI